MEYGEAIDERMQGHAVAAARRALAEQACGVEEAAAIGVSTVYCVCVTEGEDAAEHRLSDIHRELIDAVAARLHDRTDQ